MFPFHFISARILQLSLGVYTACVSTVSSDRNNYLCTYDLYSPVHNVWMRAYPLRGEVGGGWALEFESFLGPQVMDMHASKTLCTGLYKS